VNLEELHEIQITTLCVVLAAVLTAPASPHHSFAMFDFNKR